MKLANSIWELPDYYDQESFFGATDDDWDLLVNKTKSTFIEVRVQKWLFGENEKRLYINFDGKVYAGEIK